MARDISEYVALALVRKIEKDQAFYRRSEREDFSGDFDTLHEAATARCGFPVPPEILRNTIRVLADWQLLRVTEDAYSGTYYKIRSDQFEDKLNSAKEELSTARNSGLTNDDIVARRSDYPLGSAFVLHEVFEDYDDHGEAWLTRALDGLQRQIEDGSLELDSRFDNLQSEEIPASDRIVKLTDNQIAEFDDHTSKLISAVSQQNTLGETEGLRELILGQLKAGRELFRSGCIRLYLVRTTLFEILTFLAKRYEKEAIGALASALLAALLTHLGIA